MKRFNPITTLLFATALLQTQTRAQLNNSNNETTSYAYDQCTYWLFTLQSSDLDSSGTLSLDEYYTFLTSIEDPSYVNEYFLQYENFANLPWQYKVIHRTMACNCMRMGQSSGCCMGNDVEVMLGPTMLDGGSSGAVPQMRQSAIDEYEQLLCQQIGFLVSSVDVPPTMQPATSSPVASTFDSSAAPNSAPQDYVGKDATVDGATIEEGAGYEEETTTNTTLGAGAIVGILFAILVPLCGGCFVVARQRKMEEEKRLREFAGEAAKEDHLEVFDAMNEKRELLPDTQQIEDLKLENEEEIVVTPEPTETNEEPKVEKPLEEDEESKDDDSVWSDGDDEKDDREVIVEIDQEAPQSLVGSALAALGVASTVATSIISPTNASKKKVDEEEDATKINALV